MIWQCSLLGSCNSSRFPLIYGQRTTDQLSNCVEAVTCHLITTHWFLTILILLFSSFILDSVILLTGNICVLQDLFIAQRRTGILYLNSTLARRISSWIWKAGICSVSVAKGIHAVKYFLPFAILSLLQWSRPHTRLFPRLSMICHISSLKF
jgi:hypothetical protein